MALHCNLLNQFNNDVPCGWCAVWLACHVAGVPCGWCAVWMVCRVDGVPCERVTCWRRYYIARASRTQIQSSLQGLHGPTDAAAFIFFPII